METSSDRFGHAERIEWGYRAACARALAASVLDLAPADLETTTRGVARAALARQIAMYLAHVSFEMSLAKVADAFGRDRSTVAHACHRIEDLREEPRFDSWLDGLEEALRAINDLRGASGRTGGLPKGATR